MRVYDVDSELDVRGLLLNTWLSAKGEVRKNIF